MAAAFLSGSIPMNRTTRVEVNSTHLIRYAHNYFPHNVIYHNYLTLFILLLPEDIDRTILVGKEIFRPVLDTIVLVFRYCRKVTT